MAQVALKRVVALTAHQAFAIAADVAAYKEFVPLVTRATIRGKVVEQGDIKRFAADLMIAVERLGLRESFTSQVEVNAAAGTVLATSSDGPVKSLRALWKISALDGTRSSVEIAIDYTLRSTLLQMAASGLMDRAVAKVMEAFEARGRKLYPESAISNI